MNKVDKLLRDCQRLCSLLDGTESTIGYPEVPGTLGTGRVSVYYDLRTQCWQACADWECGCILKTNPVDYPKDAARQLKRLLEAEQVSWEPQSKRRAR